MTLSWVRDAQVDAKHGQAVVIVQAGQYDRQALLKVVDGAGYQARVIKEEPGPTALTMQR